MGTKEFFTEQEIQNIKRNYPKCYNLITRLVCNSDAPEIPADIKEKTLAISDLLVKSMLTSSARELYDFFDDHGVVCSLEYDHDERAFYYCIYDKDDKEIVISQGRDMTVDVSQVRRALEVEMFKRAFEMVEDGFGEA